MHTLTRFYMALSICCFLIMGFSTHASAKPPGIEERITHLTEKLALNDTQAQLIQSILVQQKVKKDALLARYGIDEDFHKQLRSIHQEGATEIEEQLSEDQAATFRELRKQHRKHAKQSSGRTR